MKESPFLIKTINVILCCIAASIPVTVNASDLSLSENGLGSISEKTGFNMKDIQKSLPGYTVKADKDYTVGDEFPIYVVMGKQGIPLATINPSGDEKGIFSIRVKSNVVLNTLGPKIGTTYLSVYGKVVDESCSPGMEEMSGAVICNAPKSKHIVYVFNGKNGGPDSKLPDISLLKNFKISEIAWLNTE